MSQRTFEYKEADGIATVTLNRPQRRNALTPGDYEGLRDVAAQLRYREEIRVLVIRGAGGAFCAGGDLDETAAKVLKKGARANFEFMRVPAELVRNLREMPQPVIAAVDGIAAGAGAALALAADLRIFTSRATLDFVFTKIGLSGGDMGAAWFLQRLIGLSAATELLMLGSALDSARAHALGLAHCVVEPEDIDSATNEMVASLLQRPGWGLSATKQVLNRATSIDYSTALDLETWSQAMLMTAPDFSEFAERWTQRKRKE